MKVSRLLRKHSSMNPLLFIGLEPPSDEELVTLYQKFLTSVHVSTTSKQYALVSLAKLSTRVPDKNGLVNILIK